MCSNCQMWRTSAISGRTTSRITKRTGSKNLSASRRVSGTRWNSCAVSVTCPARTVVADSLHTRWTSITGTAIRKPSGSRNGRARSLGIAYSPSSKSATSFVQIATELVPMRGRWNVAESASRQAIRRGSKVGFAAIKPHYFSSCVMSPAPTATSGFHSSRWTSIIGILPISCLRCRECWAVSPRRNSSKR